MSLRRIAWLLLPTACGGVTESSNEGTTAASSGATSSTSSSGSTGTAAADSSSEGDVRYDLGGGMGTTYLLALSTPLAPELPLQFLAEIVVAQATLSITLQPLALEQDSTTSPRQPVGDPLDADEMLMTPAFSASFAAVTLPAAANPISGQDLAGSFELVGSLAGTGAPCGTADGMVTAPTRASLAGSTWAAVLVDDIGALPTDFPMACP